MRIADNERRQRQALTMTTFFRAIGWAAVVTIAVLSLVSGEQRPHTVYPGQLEHVVAYLGTAGALTLGYRSRAPMVALLLAGYAGALEILQIWVPGRNAAFIDFVSSSLGASAGVCLAMLFQWALIRS